MSIDTSSLDKIKRMNNQAKQIKDENDIMLSLVTQDVEHILKQVKSVEEVVEEVVVKNENENEIDEDEILEEEE